MAKPQILTLERKGFIFGNNHRVSFLAITIHSGVGVYAVLVFASGASGGKIGHFSTCLYATRVLS